MQGKENPIVRDFCPQTLVGSLDEPLMGILQSKYIKFMPKT